jgi:hypothetical protein
LSRDLKKNCQTELRGLYLGLEFDMWISMKFMFGGMCDDLEGTIWFIVRGFAKQNEEDWFRSSESVESMPFELFLPTPHHILLEWS